MQATAISRSAGETAFLLGIPRVVSASAEEEMIGVDTSADVAAMKNTQTLRDRSVVSFINEAMCKDGLLTALGLVSQLAVSAAIATTGPQPAVSALVDLVPETIIYE